MKRILCTVLLVITAGVVFGQTSITDRPVAVIKLHKTEVLPQTKFRRYENTMKLQKQGEDLTQEEKKQLLDVLVNQLLVRQDAEKLGITVTDSEVLPRAMQTLSLELQQAQRIPSGAILNDEEQFRQLLVSNGHDYDLYLENTKNSMLIEAYVTQTKRAEFEKMQGPTENALLEVYNQNISQFAQPEYVMISQIFFDTSKAGSDRSALKNQADDLFQKINSGNVDYEESIKTAGSDFPYTQIKGQPFTIARSDAQAYSIFGETFTDGLFDNKQAGLVYLLESSIGFHIVRIEDHRESRILALDDKINPIQEATVRDYLTQMISAQLQQQLYAQLQQQVVLELREKAEINTFEDAL